LLLLLVLEVSPLGENLHSLDVFDGCQLFSVILVTAKSVQVELLTQALVLVLNLLQDVVDLFAVKYLLVVHTGDGVEDGPHDFWVVDSTKMISDVEAEDNLVQLSLLNSDSLVTKGWWKFSEEVWESDGSHVELTHWVVFSPCVLESLNIFFLKSQDIILILSLLVIVERFTDNGNEDIHEDEERNELEGGPVDNGNKTGSGPAIVHDTIP